MSDDEQRAEAFAARHHGAKGQVRKYTGEPYISHPKAVAEIVRSVPHTTAMLCAALLHDTVEDTDATLEEIKREFGTEVASLVEMLTNVSTLEDGNRQTRHAIDLEHTARASPDAKTVKLADVIHNASTVMLHDAAWGRIYLREKLALLEVLKEGDPTLWNGAREICNQSQRGG